MTPVMLWRLLSGLSWGYLVRDSYTCRDSQVSQHSQPHPLPSGRELRLPPPELWLPLAILMASVETVPAAVPALYGRGHRYRHSRS